MSIEFAIANTTPTAIAFVYGVGFLLDLLTYCNNAIKFAEENKGVDAWELSWIRIEELSNLPRGAFPSWTPIILPLTTLVVALFWPFHLIEAAKAVLSGQFR